MATKLPYFEECETCGNASAKYSNLCRAFRFKPSGERCWGFMSVENARRVDRDITNRDYAAIGRSADGNKLFDEIEVLRDEAFKTIKSE